jgi:hypothetical protein
LATVQVGVDEVGAASRSPDLRDHGVTSLAVSPGHHDVGPFGAVGEGDGAADVAGGAGDECGLALKSVHDSHVKEQKMDFQVQIPGVMLVR